MQSLSKWQRDKVDLVCKKRRFFDFNLDTEKLIQAKYIAHAASLPNGLNNIATSCVCKSVCTCLYLKNHTCMSKSCQIFCACCLKLSRSFSLCNTLCTSGYVNRFMFPHNCHILVAYAKCHSLSLHCHLHFKPRRLRITAREFYSINPKVAWLERCDEVNNHSRVVAHRRF